MNKKEQELLSKLSKKDVESKSKNLVLLPLILDAYLILCGLLDIGILNAFPEIIVMYALELLAAILITINAFKNKELFNQRNSLVKIKIFSIAAFILAIAYLIDLIINICMFGAEGYVLAVIAMFIGQILVIFVSYFVFTNAKQLQKIKELE